MAYVPNPDDRPGTRNNYSPDAIGNQKHGQGGVPTFTIPSLGPGEKVIKGYGWHMDVRITTGAIIGGNDRNATDEPQLSPKWSDPDLRGYGRGPYGRYGYGT